MSEVVTVSPLAARRFMRRALLLDSPAPDVAAALSHLGYVQIDPINVCGRMHDHILRLRVAGYREGDLMRHLHGDGTPLAAERRLAFEHHLPTPQQILVAFPVTAWPHLLAAMHARTRRAGPWSGRLTPRERELAPSILAELAARGPLGSEDLHDGRQARRVWGSMTLAKSTLQKMFFHGRVLIAARDQNRRLYHLPERVLPAAVLNQPVPPARDTTHWLARTKLQQRRLTTLLRDEVAAIGEEAQRVKIEGCPPLYILKEDLPNLLGAFESPSSQVPSPNSDVQLLGPLDPLIYERRVTRGLWGFDYTWEAYTPAKKRVRGHYALPILAGCELVGHVDPKADRERRRLRVVSRRVRRGHKVAGAVRELARFLGLR
ncbi:MAG TPA: crosslink repair DNA glycosylase YcaQ family protein [Opitutaceae bacterium]|nr:crosslink repair DNA glycosylase YcaQ family protein [Opitutaceae bacterium]HND61527.1 crosslink repair DNA glycosylase YcaQ family protein [Opitutaceae bacterium]